MKFTQSWLEDHLQGCSLDEVLATLPRIGLEVEKLTPAAQFPRFVLAKIIDIQPHPQADRLHIVRVITHQGDYQGQIVCGAPNLRLGQISILAQPEAIIPATGKKVKATKIRGEESLGMLCSQAELGLAQESDTILEMKENVDLASNVASALGLDDTIIDVEITPNRADWAGVRGIARDLAAAGCGELIAHDSITLTEQTPSPFNIRHALNADELKACPLFVGRYIRGVQNRPSPDWLQQRLRAIGLRPMDALVDITNYICMDRARPLHVYDADKIEGDIIVRMARKGEKLNALNGIT